MRRARDRADALLSCLSPMLTGGASEGATEEGDLFLPGERVLPSPRSSCGAADGAYDGRDEATEPEHDALRFADPPTEGANDGA